MNVKLLVVYQLEHSACLCSVRSADIVGNSSGDLDHWTEIIMATLSEENLKNVSS